MGKRKDRIMEKINRGPFQGVLNIIRFNWHFFVLAGLSIGVALFIQVLFPPPFSTLIFLGGILIAVTTAISLAVSYYVYDVSDLYQLTWLLPNQQHQILTINAGFDETSAFIQQKCAPQHLTIADFYDPQLHTEISIQRARKAYPPPTTTISVQSQQLPFASHSFDKTISILAAHEIRDTAERIQFFKELARVTQPNGQIIITEHLRDWSNFWAYTIGFLHFHSRATWLQTFEGAHLSLQQEIKTTPFIHTFILTPNGSTS